MIRRSGQSGVTMIEMLAALAVSAMIGVAGFTLLDGVVRQDTKLEGRIDRLLAIDRAFQLLNLDASSAYRGGLTEKGGFKLVASDYVVEWYANDEGLSRKITWPDGQSLVQMVLEGEVQLVGHPDSNQAAVLELPNDDLRRLILLPAPLAP